MNTATLVPFPPRTSVIGPAIGDRRTLRLAPLRTIHALPTVARNAVVVLVDEAQSHRQILHDILTTHHIRVLPTPDGETTLAQLATQHPDLILIDVMSTDSDAIEVCRRLKANPATTDIPVVFLAPFSTTGLAVKAIAAGAIDCIFKPYEPAELLARVHAHVARKRVQDELQRIITMKSERMNTVAHDLKNPLGSIRFSALLLRESGMDGTDPRGELIDSIIESCESALEFIHERLEEAACAEPIERLKLTRVDLIEQTHADTLQNSRAAARKDIELVLDFPEFPLAFVQADPRALSRVLNNLLSNAIKFSPPGEPVRVTIAREPAGHQMRLSVRDRGPGLTAEDRQHLFTPYRTLSARPTGGESSTGLGLSIAYDLMQQMGGRIGCDSHPGKGACFWITLPLAGRFSTAELPGPAPRMSHHRAIA